MFSKELDEISVHGRLLDNASGLRFRPLGYLVYTSAYIRHSTQKILSTHQSFFYYYSPPTLEIDSGEMGTFSQFYGSGAITGALTQTRQSWIDAVVLSSFRIVGGAH